jgi:hypothetical protein
MTFMEINNLLSDACRKKMLLFGTNIYELSKNNA